MENLTVFYNKRTGTIKEICGGVQSMSWFGNEEEDYSQIFSHIVVPYDEYILTNFRTMKVLNDRLTVVGNVIPEEYSYNEGVV